MLDFECFSNFPSKAAVVQIGALYFDPSTGIIRENGFKLNVDLQSAIDSGAELEASTVQWWLKQDPLAIRSVSVQGMNIFAAFTQLNEWLSGVERIWSHATYDFVILCETLKRLKIKPNFSYKSGMDIRTLIYLAHGKMDKTKIKNLTEAFPRLGVHHDALDDCAYQVKYVSEALRILKGKKQNE